VLRFTRIHTDILVRLAHGGVNRAILTPQLLLASFMWYI